MNARAELLLRVLCLCVRGLTTGQAMRLLGIRDEANYRRFLKPLVAAGLVNVVRVLAKPVPVMREPLFAYDPALGEAADRDRHPYEVIGVRHRAGIEEHLSTVLYRARKRWADVSAVLTTCVVATRKAGQLYGVKRTATLTKPLQSTHDLALSEVAILRQTTGDVVQANNWIGEDATDFTLGFKKPDVVVFGGSPGVNGISKIIELVGADYTHDKLLIIHRECNSRGLTYELW